MSPRCFAWLASATALLLLVGGAGASEDAAGDPPPDPAPTVGLDALLRLPSPDAPGPGRPEESADRQHWEERFAGIRSELADAKRRLAEAQHELETLARGAENWQMAAPGAKHDPDTSPISFKLRSDIRRYREEISLAERRLRELDVEASLAGVPPEWRRPPTDDASPDS